MAIEETARAILDRSKATREEWLELHDQHLGGSDAGAVMGLSRYRTPLSVYVTKTGILPHSGESDYTRWGNLLEGVVRREFPKDYSEQEKKGIRVIEDSNMYESLQYPWMCCDPDGLVQIEGNGVGLLEIKTTTGRQRKEWADDQVPDEYYSQVQHNMMVLGFNYSLIVVLMDKTLFWRFVPLRVGFVTDLVRIEKEFWQNYVEAAVAPAPSGEDIDFDILKDLYPQAEDVTVDLTGSLDVTRYLEIVAEVKALEHDKALLGQRIMGAMGKSYRAVSGDNRITWSRSEMKRFDTSTFKTDHPKLAERYAKTIPISRLYVS